MIRFGLVTDVQYSDEENSKLCCFRLSPAKLNTAVETFNEENVEFVFQLGDFINRDWQSYEAVLPLLQKLQMPCHSVLGNHDYVVEDDLKLKVPTLLGLPSRYYSFTCRNWCFIVLDGNEISLNAWPQESYQFNEAENYLSAYPGAEPWNGAFSESQFEWLKSQLDQAENNMEKVILLCHFPILPESRYCLWNHLEVSDFISGYNCIKAWLNGHQHAGNYHFKNGIHFITFKGMVDTEENSYAIVELLDQQINIKGFGREESRELHLQR